jgi:hypothetical protein
MSRTPMSRTARRNLWIAGGVVFVGVAVVAAGVAAWAGMVSGLLLAAVQFGIAAKLPAEAADPDPAPTAE